MDDLPRNALGELDVEPQLPKGVESDPYWTLDRSAVPTYEEARDAELLARVAVLVENATPAELLELESWAEAAEAAVVMHATVVAVRRCESRRPHARTRGVRRVRRVNRLRSGRSPDDSGDPAPGPRQRQGFRGTGNWGCR
jgi:hypothetical protein